MADRRLHAQRLLRGVSGGIYAFYIGLLSPDPFSFRAIVDLLV